MIFSEQIDHISSKLGLIYGYKVSIKGGIYMTKLKKKHIKFLRERVEKLDQFLRNMSYLLTKIHAKTIYLGIYEKIYKKIKKFVKNCLHEIP